MSTSERVLRIIKYIPNRMFGFVGMSMQDPPEAQTFFHLRTFQPGPSPTNAGCSTCKQSPCEWATAAPLPIIGEEVRVQLEADPDRPNRSRAARVERVHPPVPATGVVETFDAPRGYGFIKGADGLAYYLHRSEVIEGRIPVAGQRVVFYTATRVEKARACHVKVCPEVPR